MITEGERLQKILARAGIGSRRASEEFIAAGRVTVNGEVAVLGRRVDPEVDAIALDGIPVGTKADLAYYLINKPVHIMCTASDPQGRPTVIELVPRTPRVFPVGRLDWETEGLLVLTNDGDLSHRLTHPSFGVEKEYLVEVEGVPSRAALRLFREGIDLKDGRTAPASANLVTTQGENAAIEVIIHEGRNRQVRRMCEALGHPVRRLVRTRIGPISDRTLGPGLWRHLEPGEVRSLWAAATEDLQGAPPDALPNEADAEEGSG